MTIKAGKTCFTFGFSFFAVVTLMLIFFQRDIVMQCLLSSLFHESGHLVFMYAFSCAPDAVIFGAFGIRIERREMTAASYTKEAVIAAGGIIFNLLAAAVLFLLYAVSGGISAYSGAFVNLFVAAVNLIPVSMLDCGRFLRYILLAVFDETKALGILDVISDVSVCLICVCFVLYTIFVGFNISFCVVCAYITIVNFKSPGAD